MSRPSNPQNDMFNMVQMAEDTESERRAKEQMRIEARKIRTKELEKQRKEDEDSDSVASYGKYNVHNSSKYSSRNSSVEPSAVNLSSRNLDPREIKVQMVQMEEKLKNAMVVNAQLDSEKQLLRYEVDLLKDKLEDFIDANHSLSKLSTERKKEIAYQRMQITELNRRLEIAKQQIEARDQLLTDKGFVLFGAQNDDEENSDITDIPNSRIKTADLENSLMLNGTLKTTNTNLQNGIAPLKNEAPHIPGMALISKEVADSLYLIPGNDLESRLMHMLRERTEFSKRQTQLEVQLEEQREKADIAQRYDSRPRSRGGLQDPDDLKLLQTARQQAQEYKFKFQESLQKVSSLEGDIIRLEGQVKRNKVIAETCEAQENELKQDKRKLQREVREMTSQIEDLKSENATLQKRLEKLSRAPAIPGSGSTLRLMREGSQAR